MQQPHPRQPHHGEPRHGEFSARPALRLVVHDGPRSEGWTLDTVYRQLLRPSLVDDGCAAATLASHDESLDWWVQITGDPPLPAIAEETLGRFKRELRSVTYKRGAAGRPRLLAAFTQRKHLCNVRAVLLHAGQGSPRREGRKLCDELPRLVVKSLDTDPKPHFTLSAARAVIAATQTMVARVETVWASVPLPAFFLAYLLVLFYTGLRAGTVRRLRYSMLEYSDGEERLAGHWIRVPAAVERKTHKGRWRYLHPAAYRAIDAIRTPGRDLIFESAEHVRTFHDRHKRLQQALGTPEEKCLSLQAWRRTHGTWLTRLGAKQAKQIAQRALDHASARTTSQFYVSEDEVEAEFIAQLPDLTPAAVDRQLELF